MAKKAKKSVAKEPKKKAAAPKKAAAAVKPNLQVMPEGKTEVSDILIDSAEPKSAFIEKEKKRHYYKNWNPVNEKEAQHLCETELKNGNQVLLVKVVNEKRHPLGFRIYATEK